MFSDEFWSKLEKILVQEAIYNKRNLRMIVEGMLYRMRVGCPWGDLPKAFGYWNSIYKRFNAWSLSNKWLRIFRALTRLRINSPAGCWRCYIKNFPTASSSRDVSQINHFYGMLLLFDSEPRGQGQLHTLLLGNWYYHRTNHEMSFVGHAR